MLRPGAVQVEDSRPGEPIRTVDGRVLEPSEAASTVLVQVVGADEAGRLRVRLHRAGASPREMLIGGLPAESSDALANIGLACLIPFTFVIDFVLFPFEVVGFFADALPNLGPVR
jgi:hypothetical protein